MDLEISDDTIIILTHFLTAVVIVQMHLRMAIRMHLHLSPAAAIMKIDGEMFNRNKID
jgi:hypothetical protein